MNIHECASRKQCGVGNGSSERVQLNVGKQIEEIHSIFKEPLSKQEGRPPIDMACANFEVLLEAVEFVENRDRGYGRTVGTKLERIICEIPRFDRL